MQHPWFLSESNCVDPEQTVHTGKLKGPEAKNKNQEVFLHFTYIPRCTDPKSSLSLQYQKHLFFYHNYNSSHFFKH